MYEIVLTLTFKELGGHEFAMTTNVLDFRTLVEAETAYRLIEDSYPKHAVYATAVKLYKDY